MQTTDREQFQDNSNREPNAAGCGVQKMWSEDLSPLTSPISHYAPSAQTALVCERTQKAAVHHGAYEGHCVGTIPHQRTLPA